MNGKIERLQLALQGRLMAETEARRLEVAQITAKLEQVSGSVQDSGASQEFSYGEREDRQRNPELMSEEAHSQHLAMMNGVLSRLEALEHRDCHVPPADVSRLAEDLAGEATSRIERAEERFVDDLRARLGAVNNMSAELCSKLRLEVSEKIMMTDDRLSRLEPLLIEAASVRSRVGRLEALYRGADPDSGPGRPVEYSARATTGGVRRVPHTAWTQDESGSFCQGPSSATAEGMMFMSRGSASPPARNHAQVAQDRMRVMQSRGASPPMGHDHGRKPSSGTSMLFSQSQGEREHARKTPLRGGVSQQYLQSEQEMYSSRVHGSVHAMEDQGGVSYRRPSDSSGLASWTAQGSKKTASPLRTGWPGS